MALTARRTTKGFELIGHLFNKPTPARPYLLTPNTAFSAGDMVVLTAGKVAKAAAGAVAVLGVMAADYTTTDNPSGADTYGLVFDDPFNIYRCSFVDHIDSTATGGSTTTLVDTALSTSSDDDWNGATVLIYSGTNAGEFRLVKDYTGGSDTLAFEDPFPAACDTTTKYIIMGVGGTDDVIYPGQVGIDLKDENAIDANATVGSEAGPLACYNLNKDLMYDLMMDVIIRKHRFNSV